MEVAGGEMAVKPARKWSRVLFPLKHPCQAAAGPSWSGGENRRRGRTRTKGWDCSATSSVVSLRLLWRGHYSATAP